MNNYIIFRNRERDSFFSNNKIIQIENNIVVIFIFRNLVIDIFIKMEGKVMK